MMILVPVLALIFLVLQSVPSRADSTILMQSVPAAALNRTLLLPHALHKGETLWLLVEVGAIGHNQIELSTQDGRRLGLISPFGVRSGQGSGTYTVPIPTDAVDKGRLALRLVLLPAGSSPRAPGLDEVKSMRLVIRPQGNNL